MTRFPRTHHFKLAAALLLTTVATAALPASFDLAQDFSGAFNPSGPWSYGEASEFGGTFTAFTNNPTDNGVHYWNVSPVPPDIPMVYFNPTSEVVDAFPGATVESHAAGFYPGIGTQVATYRFTAPSAGIYSIDATYYGQHPGGTTSEVGVTLNGVLQGSLMQIVGFGQSSARSFVDVFTLAVGDTIDFSVGDAGDAFNFNDATGIAVVITTATPVPEPSTFAMSLAGLGLISLFRKMKRSARARARSA